MQQLALDLFTEIAILEHLVRNREQELNGLTAAQFGILNYFCRLDHREARISLLAWSFQESETRIWELIDSLRANGFVVATNDNRRLHQYLTRGSGEASEYGAG